MASTDLRGLFEGKFTAGDLSPAYLLHGEEAYLVATVAGRLAEVALHGSLRGLNFDRLNAGEVGTARVAEMCMTAPMMASRRVVALSSVDRLKERDLGPLIDYLARPAGFCTLIMTAEGKRAHAALVRAVEGVGVAAEFRHIKEREVPVWIDRLAGRRGIKLDAEARAFLVRAIGSDLGGIAAAIEKAALYAGDRKKITADDLRELVADVRIDALYMLTDHLVQGRVEQALSLVDGMLERGSHPLQIMPLLVRHASQLLQGSQALRRGDDLGAVARELGVRSFLVDQFIGQVKSHKEAELERSLAHLNEADRLLKSSRLPPGIIMERLMLKLARKPGAGRGAAPGGGRRPAARA